MKKIFIFSFIITMILNLSCSEDLLDIYPKGNIVIDNLYNKEGVDLLLIAAYSALDGQDFNKFFANSSLSFSNWVFGGLQSDDAYKGSFAGDQAAMNPIEGYELEPLGNIINSGRWSLAYDGITRCNDVIKAANEAQDMTEEEINSAVAQARFLRGHFYFELTISYIVVPWIDESTVDPGEVQNDHEVWPEIEADFEFAIDHLPEEWGAGNVGRATAWAAKTYLARAHMYQSDYDLAKEILNEIYTESSFSLMSSYEYNFDITHRNNAESIFEDQRCEDGLLYGINAGFGDLLCYAQFGPFATGFGFYQPSYSLMAAYFTDPVTGLPEMLGRDYESSDIPVVFNTDGTVVVLTDPVDPRLDHTIGRPGAPFKDWGIQPATAWIKGIDNGGPFLNKKNMFGQAESDWFRRGFGGKSANNFRKFRFSHVILWLAECEIETNGDLGRAMNLVNEIRARAMNSNKVTYTQADIDAFEVLYPDDAGKFTADAEAANYNIGLYTSFPGAEYAREAVRYEQRLEFGMEGIRFFDLVRWGEAANVLQNYISTESTRMGHLQNKVFNAGIDEYLPIPQEQIDIYPDILVQNSFRD